MWNIIRRRKRVEGWFGATVPRQRPVGMPWTTRDAVSSNEAKSAKCYPRCFLGVFLATCIDCLTGVNGKYVTTTKFSRSTHSHLVGAELSPPIVHTAIKTRTNQFSDDAGVHSLRAGQATTVSFTDTIFDDAIPEFEH
jgi:hypothetical protein